MDIGIVSMRYARALLHYADGHECASRLYDEMRMLEHSLSHFPRLREALANPALNKREKLSLLSTAAVGEGKTSREFARFVTLVMKNGREPLLHYICLAFLDLYRRARHIHVGRLVTAVTVSEEVKRRIREGSSRRLQAHTELRTEVDPSLEGGFVLEIDGVRLDASVATQLKSVKRQFIDKNRRIV
ncbi:MAG: F0F1 ATP synthase subunit delta [Bacteroides sp.]|nr:F0F1 ATP synthase subunit delta [Bacteroides sp.]